MRRFALGVIAALFLVGCTTSPPTPSSTVNAEQIIYTIITELYCAAIDKQLQVQGTDSNGKPDTVSYFASDDNWVVGIDLYLSASVEASVSPSISLLGPFNLGKAVPTGGTTGSFTSAFGGTFDQTRTNLREYKIYIYMKTLISGAQYTGTKVPDWSEFSGTHCGANSEGIYDKDSYLTSSARTFLVGRLGLKDWLLPAVRAQTTTQRYSPAPVSSQGNGNGGDQKGGGSAGSGQIPTIGDTITFTIKATGTLGPSFTLTRVSGGSNSLFSGTRTDNDYVDIVFTPATYCWTTPEPQPIGCPQPTLPVGAAATTPRRALTFYRASVIHQARQYPTVSDIQAATQRIDNALLNLNLVHAFSP